MEQPSVYALYVNESQVIRLDVGDANSVPFVGKSFSMAMLPDPQATDESDGQVHDPKLGICGHGTTRGAFDCMITDQTPAGFECPEPLPALSAYYLRRPGYPVEQQWSLTGKQRTVQFRLNRVPRFINSTGASVPTEGARFHYEGRAPVRIPACFTSEVTVRPTQIPVGKTTDVTLTLVLDKPSPAVQPGGKARILIQGRLPTVVGDASITVDRPDPVYIKSFVQTCVTGRPYMIYGSAVAETLPPDFIPKYDGSRPRPDQDPRLGGIPASIDFRLHVCAHELGPLRLERVLWCTQGIDDVILPVATASSPQAKDVRYRAGASVERFHSVTINVK